MSGEIILNVGGNLRVEGMAGYYVDITEDNKTVVEGSAIYCDLTAELLSGCNFILEFEIYVKHLPKRRWFYSDRVLEYYRNESAEEIKGFLNTTKNNCQCHEEIISEIKGKKIYPHKRFSVFSEDVDENLIKAYYATLEPEQWIHACVKTQRVSFEDMRNTFKNAKCDYAIILGNNEAIFISPEHYPVQQLLNRIQTVATKHNKTLEVNI